MYRWKNGKNSEDVKVAMVTFQNLPKGFSPYFTLVGHAQTINESDYFGDFFVTACLH